MSSVDSIFGMHGAALELRARRVDILASNIANAATPNYKARDIDFGAMLRAAETGPSLAVDAPEHIARPSAGLAARPGYRVPVQASLDGNTVELSTEQTQFAENAVRYQVSLSFCSGEASELIETLKSGGS